MKLRILLLLALCLTAQADVYRLSITSAPYNDGEHAVGFYNSSFQINENLAIPLLTVCVDFTHQVGFNSPFEVTVVNLANYNGPLATNYLQAAWLILQLNGLTDVNAISQIHRGIWLITTPGTSDPYLLTSGAFAWANQAALNYQSVDASQFTLFLRSGATGQNQIGYQCVPEPTTWAFCAVGLIALVGLRRFK